MLETKLKQLKAHKKVLPYVLLSGLLGYDYLGGLMVNDLYKDSKGIGSEPTAWQGSIPEGHHREYGDYAFELKVDELTGSGLYFTDAKPRAQGWFLCFDGPVRAKDNHFLAPDEVFSGFCISDDGYQRVKER